MKVTCPISGIKYTINNPVRGHAIHPHPMLSSTISLQQLTEWYYVAWATGDLPAVETHLLGCAMLVRLPIKSIGLPVMDEAKLEKWDKFWAANLEKLSRLAVRLDKKETSLKNLPQLVVDSDSLALLPEWLQDLESAINYNSAPVSEKAKELNRGSYKHLVESGASGAVKLLDADELDALILRAMRGSPLSNNESKALPVIVSDWARKVTDFPDHSKMLFQRIIQTIFDKDAINLVLMSNIKLEQVKALETHLQLNTPAHAVGTKHSTILMERLAEFIPVFEMFSPEISSRRNIDDSDMMTALSGDAPRKVTTQATAPRKVTGESLQAKLQARLAAINAKKGA